MENPQARQAAANAAPQPAQKRAVTVRGLALGAPHTLGGPDHVSGPDDPFVEDLGSQAPAVDQRRHHPWLGQLFEILAGLAEPHPSHPDRADPELAVHQVVQWHIARGDVPPRLCRRQLDPVALAPGVDDLIEKRPTVSISISVTSRPPGLGRADQWPVPR